MAQKVSPKVLHKQGKPLKKNGGFSSKFGTLKKNIILISIEGIRSLLLTRIGHFLKKTYQK